MNNVNLNVVALLVLSATCAALCACGGGADSSTEPATTHFVAPESSAFAVAVDPASPSTTLVGPADGTYAGKRLLHAATVNANAQTLTGYASSALVYKGAGGGIFKMALNTSTAPAPVPLSSERQATIDDTCSYSPGPNLLGTFVASDYTDTNNSAYFYRLPGADGQCGTADDVVHMVKAGMSASDAPIAALMPIAVARSAAGAVTGYVAIQGATLALFDADFGHPVVLYTAGAPIVWAYRVGGVGIASTEAFFVVDGEVIHADYVAGSSSASLFTLSTPGDRIPAVGTSSGLYFVDTVPGGTAATIEASIYRLAPDGRSAPTRLTTEHARVGALQAPVDAGLVFYATASATGQYMVKSLSIGDATVGTVLASNGNTGNFTAVGRTVYYTTGTRTQTAEKTFVFGDTRTGVVRSDATVIVPELPNSRFAPSGEIDETLSVTHMLRVRGLTPVTALVAASGATITDDGVAGGTLEAIDTGTNLIGPVLGVLPSTTLAFLGTASIGDAGFIVGSTRNSTANPASRELFFVNTAQAGSLVRLSSHLP